MVGVDLPYSGFRQILSCSVCPPEGRCSPNWKPEAQASGMGSCWAQAVTASSVRGSGLWCPHALDEGGSPLGQTCSQECPLIVWADTSRKERVSLPSWVLGAHASLGILVERPGLSRREQVHPPPPRHLYEAVVCATLNMT